ncbi:MAG: primosomal protein N', partial [Armatimonadota bacterium]|nr:primosomal protein N' [Armatimonadota bacterium]
MTREEKPMYADIVVLVDVAGLPQPLTYRIPAGMTVSIGAAVVVPFGAQQATGYVVNLKDDCPPEMQAKIKPVTAQIENAITFNEELRDLAFWVVEQTLCDLRDAVRLIAPDVLTSQIKTTLHLADDWEEKLASTRSKPQRELAQTLAALGGQAESGKLAKAVGETKIGSTLAELRKKGALTEQRVVSLPPARRKLIRVLRLAVEPDVAREEATRLERQGATRQARLLRALVDAEQEQAGSKVPASGLAVGPSAGAAARALSEKNLARYSELPVRRDPFRFFGFVEDTAPALTDAQARAAEALGQHLSVQSGQTLLLYGVTGSGKTEVYLDAVSRTLDLGLNALVLLPEIGLTAQVLDLFKARFGEEAVAVLHSALSLGERHDEWRRIKSGEARVIVGARSAVFAPVARLGLIVLDEEHDGSYKQDSAPRYHARDVARRRAEQSGAVVLLGSATPSLETYHQALTGEYELLTLAERIDSRPLPPVQIVDLREEFKAKKNPPPPSAHSSLRGTPPETGGERDLGALPPHSPVVPAAEALRAGAAGSRETSGMGPGKSGIGGSDPPPPSIFSSTLADALAECLARKEQAILFLNRRG